MAKALFGHVGAADPRVGAMHTEITRLRSRVADLESALERECRATAELRQRLELLDSIAMAESQLLTLDREPALA
jgi:hypothetical protein